MRLVYYIDLDCFHLWITLEYKDSLAFLNGARFNNELGGLIMAERNLIDFLTERLMFHRTYISEPWIVLLQSFLLTRRVSLHLTLLLLFLLGERSKRTETQKKVPYTNARVFKLCIHIDHDTFYRWWSLVCSWLTLKVPKNSSKLLKKSSTKSLPTISIKLIQNTYIISDYLPCKFH